MSAPPRSSGRPSATKYQPAETDIEMGAQGGARGQPSNSHKLEEVKTKIKDVRTVMQDNMGQKEADGVNKCAQRRRHCTQITHSLQATALTHICVAPLTVLAVPFSERTIIRGQQLEEIEQRSEVLLVDSTKFQDGARATKKMFCRRNARNIIIICVIAAVSRTKDEKLCKARHVQ